MTPEQCKEFTALKNELFKDDKFVVLDDLDVKVKRYDELVAEWIKLTPQKRLEVIRLVAQETIRQAQAKRRALRVGLEEQGGILS
jgi:hypothetical protein